MSQIAIVGMGYGGLPLALQFVRAGCRVVGLDIDARKVAALNAGESYIRHVPAAAVAEARTSGNLEALNDEGKAMKGSQLLILGLAYKANVDDERFVALGAKAEYHDPFVPVIPRTREHAEYAGRKSVSAITPDYDLIALSTGHEVYKSFDFSNYPMPLVDTRNSVSRRPVNYYRA